MEVLKIELPESVATELKNRRETVTEIILLGLSQLKIQEALTFYKRGLVSMGRAAEIAGLTEEEMVAQARAANITPRWDEQMVREELA
jgi:predicted HTH domain antitoxin